MEEGSVPIFCSLPMTLVHTCEKALDLSTMASSSQFQSVSR
jgi:hypothetical protein